MSISKLILGPIKLFRKSVISFLIIHRYDLEVHDRKLQYISVKPDASLAVLRQKVWHLLDLPDYCEEVIILKSDKNVEVPLLELRRGNDPQHPFIMEVWLPRSSSAIGHMLTIGDTDTFNKAKHTSIGPTSEGDISKDEKIDSCKNYAVPKETITRSKLQNTDRRMDCNSLSMADYKKPNLSSRISSTSLFRLQGKKSRDNFVNVLLKIQNDLNTLSVKLSNLESKISV